MKGIFFEGVNLKVGAVQFGAEALKRIVYFLLLVWVSHSL